MTIVIVAKIIKIVIIFIMKIGYRYDRILVMYNCGRAC